MFGIGFLYVCGQNLFKAFRIFEGIGKLTGYQLLVHTDPSVATVAQPLRRIP